MRQDAASTLRACDPGKVLNKIQLNPSVGTSYPVCVSTDQVLRSGEGNPLISSSSLS
jgi:hypothetical protein